MNDRIFPLLLKTAAIFGLLAVIVGAFGAHYLKDRVPPEDLEVIRTGVLYMFVHTLAILFVVSLDKNRGPSRSLKGSGALFALGIILFSGSLFFIGLRSLSGLSMSYFGLITPLGGFCFILGWTLLLIHAFQSDR